MTKVAFICHRANHLKHFGPVIDAALGRGWQVECWLQEKTKGEKDYLRITPEMIAVLWGERVKTYSFAQANEIPGLNRLSKPNAIISLYSRSYYMDTPNGECFITLQHSVDLFVHLTADQLASSDYVCIYSPFWWDYAVKYYSHSSGLSAESLENQLRRKIAYTGFVQMDAFASIDRKAVRADWGIPLEKKIVLALPIDLAGWPGPWPAFFQEQGLSQWWALWKVRKHQGFISKYWKWAHFGWNDASLARAIHSFCERNNAVLLLKGREKDPIRPVWGKGAVLSLYDHEHYVPTIFKAIAVADLCILFYSTAVQEAAHVGVPSLCIDRPNKDSYKHRLWRQSTPGGPYNFPGVVDWTTIPDVIQRLPSMDIAGFSIDEEAQQEYLALYNGPADNRASQRVLDLVSK